MAPQRAQASRRVQMLPRQLDFHTLQAHGLTQPAPHTH